MKKNYLVILSLLCISQLHGIEMRVGKSDFLWDVKFSTLFHDSKEMDVQVYSIYEDHKNLTLFKDDKYYYFYNLDFFNSSYTYQESSMHMGAFEMPFDGQYKIRGFDLNLGMGYDFYKADQNHIGIGVNLGVSMPWMKVKDLSQEIEFIDTILTSEDTKMTTYKFGPAVHMKYQLAKEMFFYGYMSYGLENGSMENDGFHMSTDIRGTYQVYDFGVKKENLFHKNIYMALGYTYKRWDDDDIYTEMKNPEMPMAGQMDTAMRSKSIYIGLGYQF